eukprot:11407004-Alexandrium_andersonii.AAC.1
MCIRDSPRTSSSHAAAASPETSLPQHQLQVPGHRRARFSYESQDQVAPSLSLEPPGLVAPSFDGDLWSS